jgi:hypothetical protein
MNGLQEKELFARMPISQFEQWLGEHMEQCTQYLTSASDPVAIHRAQGKALFISEMKKLLAAAKTL